MSADMIVKVEWNVPTTELAEGNIVLDHGMILLLVNRREYPAESQEQGPCVTFRGVVLNIDEIREDAAKGDAIARFIVGSVWRNNSVVPQWTVQGNRLAGWGRVQCMDCDAPAVHVHQGVDGYEGQPGPRCQRHASPAAIANVRPRCIGGRS